MTDLEKLITELCDLPSIVFAGDEAVEVHYAAMWNDQTSVVLENWQYCIYLDPGQALSLLSWLQGQKDNLTVLLDALRTKRIEDEATKEQRAAERINALKAKHSDAVTAWQQGGCKGPCPRFEDIANPKVEFIMKFPCWELLRKQQEANELANAMLADYT